MKSIFAAKELLSITPEELVFLNTEMVLYNSLETTRSGFPSPSMSPMSKYAGLDPTLKSTLALNDEFPRVLVFLKTEILLLRLFTKRSYAKLCF